MLCTTYAVKQHPGKKGHTGGPPDAPLMQPFGKETRSMTGGDAKVKTQTVKGGRK